MSKFASTRLYAIVGFLAFVAIILGYLQTLRVNVNIDDRNGVYRPEVWLMPPYAKQGEFFLLNFSNNGPDDVTNLDYRFSVKGVIREGKKQRLAAGAQVREEVSSPEFKGLSAYGKGADDVNQLAGELCLIFDGRIPFVRQWILLRGKFEIQHYMMKSRALLQTERIGSGFSFMGAGC